MSGLGACPDVFSIRYKRYRLSLFQGFEWGELYDLDADPGEFKNLWDDPNYSSQRAYLIEQLVRSSFANMDKIPGPVSRA